MAEINDERHKLGGKLVFRLNAARKKARLLPPTHKYVAESVQELYEVLEALLAELRVVTLSLVADELYVEGQLLTEESLAYGDLIAELTERHLTGVSFERGMTFEELATFVALSNMKPEELAERGNWDRIFSEEGLRHVTFRRLAARDETLEDHLATEVDVEALRNLYYSVLATVKASFFDAQRSLHMGLDKMEHVVSLLVASVLEDRETLQGLSTIKNMDEYTFYHSVNVAILSLLIGSKLKLDATLLNKLGIAAILHDVGKMRIPDDILNKPGSLTDEEWQIMQSHSLEGTKFLAEQHKIEPLALVVAAQHHARHDLSGYPSFDDLDGLHFLSDLVAIADVYDALTSDRTYRRAMLPDKAMQLVIEGRGTHLHPSLVKVFAHLSGLFPVGTLVKLDSGELGVVVRADPDDLCRPKVRVLAGGDSDLKELALVDLTERGPANDFCKSIVRAVDPAEYDVNVPQILA